jgi:hypothetical protein
MTDYERFFPLYQASLERQTSDEDNARWLAAEATITTMSLEEHAGLADYVSNGYCLVATNDELAGTANTLSNTLDSSVIRRGARPPSFVIGNVARFVQELRRRTVDDEPLHSRYLQILALPALA